MFTVPPGLDGCYVSVAVVVNGVLSNVGTMSIASSGTTCDEGTRLSAADLAKVSRSGPINIADIQVSRLNVSAGAIQGTVDQGEASIHRYGSTVELMSSAPQSLVGMPGTVSAGSCLVTSGGFDSGRGALDAIFPDFQDPKTEPSAPKRASSAWSAPPPAPSLFPATSSPRCRLAEPPADCA